MNGNDDDQNVINPVSPVASPPSTSLYRRHRKFLSESDDSSSATVTEVTNAFPTVMLLFDTVLVGIGCYLNHCYQIFCAQFVNRIYFWLVADSLCVSESCKFSVL